MAESRERDSGMCVGMAVLPAPCGAGLKGQCVCTALCQACAQRGLDCSDPASAVAACGSAKPYSISQLRSQGWENRRGPWAVPMALFHFSGIFLGWAVVVVSAKAWVLLCP